MSRLILKNILVYSPELEKGFQTEFSDSVNIVHGRNTSGKSTLIQSIIYSMGINDSKDNLNDINKLDTFFRLDCELIKNEVSSKLVFVRSGDTLVLQHGNNHPIRFDGINTNNSYEYRRYKNLYSEIIDFDLFLQDQSKLVKAPLEAAVLPYYISQSVGWVYIRESIGDYRFYKNFKFDYLDYYCGIESNKDRVHKYELEREKKDLLFELKQLISYEDRNKTFKVSEIMDKRFKGESMIFLEEYQALNKDLSMKEAEHSKLCNKIGMLRGRQKVLTQIIKNIKKQKPRVDQCPTCEQALPGDLEDFYLYIQDVNDALKQKEIVKEEIKRTATALNSAELSISSLRLSVESNYRVLQSLEKDGVTFDSWMNYSANLKMLENISNKKVLCEERVAVLNSEISTINGGLNVDSLRFQKEMYFLNIFKAKARTIGVKIPQESKYQNLYSINSFPYQGVELHLLLMAYNFSFYKMVVDNPNIHTFPFLLDAIFKEDIDIESREKIFDFLSDETRNTGQFVFSVAEYKGDDTSSNPLFNIEDIKENYFFETTKLICIGDSKTKRSFLSDLDSIHDELIQESIRLLENV